MQPLIRHVFDRCGIGEGNHLLTGAYVIGRGEVAFGEFNGDGIERALGEVFLSHHCWFSFLQSFSKLLNPCVRFFCVFEPLINNTITFVMKIFKIKYLGLIDRKFISSFIKVPIYQILKTILGLCVISAIAFMSVVPGRSESPPHVYQTANNKFARIDNNPNVRNAQYYAPYVQGSKAQNFNEFSKLPLTSVQINRKSRTRDMPFNEGPSHIVEQAPSNQGYCHNCDWKQILCWTLIGLALLGLSLGLFFLVKHLLTKDNNSYRTYTQIRPDVALPPTYTGVNPVYVSPVPYSSMLMPTVSDYSASNSGQNYLTSPTSNQNLLRSAAPPLSTPSFSNGVTQPTVSWTQEVSNSYVNPVNVYPKAQH